MNPVFRWLLFASSLFFGILLMMEAGRYMGSRIRAKDVTSTGAGFGVLEGCLFGLLGLILAFSFSGAATRFDTRRQMIVEEANCIGTAYLRLDLLPVQTQPELREMFRQYVDGRLIAYNAAPDMDRVRAEISRSAVIQGQIWKKALAASQQTGTSQATMLVLPALNEMFDIGNTHYMATKIHPPKVVYLLMFILILVCSLLAGFEMGFGKARSWIHAAGFASLLAITVYTIVDLEYPRLGLFRIKAMDQALIDVRNSMDTGAGEQNAK